MAVSCLQVSGGHNGAMPWCPCLQGRGVCFTTCGGYVSCPEREVVLRLGGRFLSGGGSFISPCPHPACSKTALLEGLEVDQYMLGILIYIQK